MARTLTPEEAVERARRVQDERINAIRSLAEARQGLEDTRAEAARRLAEAQREAAEMVAAAERVDVKEYNAAIAAGWSPDELKKIGYPEPEKKARVRRKSSGRSRAPRPVTEESGGEFREGDAA